MPTLHSSLDHLDGMLDLLGRRLAGLGLSIRCDGTDHVYDAPTGDGIGDVVKRIGVRVSILHDIMDSIEDKLG